MKISKFSLSISVAAVTAAVFTGGFFALSTARAADKIVIGFSQANFNSPWRMAQVTGNKKYAEANLPDVELIVTDGQGQSNKQATDVESLVARGVKVLMLSPLTAQALSPAVKEAMAAGIPVVTLDRHVNTDVTAHVGALNRPIGVEAANFLAKTLGEKGNIIEVMGNAGASVTIDRSEGFHEQLKKYPDMKVVSQQYCDFMRESAVRYVEDMLQRYPKGQLAAIYAHNDEMALGAIQVLEAAGRLEDVKVIGIDGQEKAFKAVKDGKMLATFVYPIVAPEGIQIAYKLAKGEQVPKDTVLKETRVDAANVNEFIGKGF